MKKRDPYDQGPYYSGGSAVYTKRVLSRHHQGTRRKGRLQSRPYFLLLWRQERPIPRCRGPTALDH